MSRPTKSLLRECELNLRIANELEPFSVRQFNEAARQYLRVRAAYHEWAMGKSQRSQYETPKDIVRMLGLDK